MSSSPDPWLLENGTDDSLPDDTNQADGGGPTTTNSAPIVFSTPPPDGFSRYIITLALRPFATLHARWANYYHPGAFGEEGIIMPGTALNFLMTGLLYFIQIRSQSQSDFPFQSHPKAIQIAITSLIMCAFAYGAEQNISAATPEYV